MSLTRKKWEEKRSESELSLRTLLVKREENYQEFEYICTIMSSLYNENFGTKNVKEFMEMVTTGNLYDLSTMLTLEEYGDPK